MVSNKITDQKLDEHNYFQWMCLVEVNVTGRGKKHYLTRAPLTYHSKLERADHSTVI